MLVLWSAWLSDKLKNCWEVKKCGRGPDDAKTEGQIPCSAANENEFTGINGGRFGGRVCWAVAGTLCEGKLQGLFAEKIESCVNCKFFKQVFSEQGETFQMYPGDNPDSVEKEACDASFEEYVSPSGG